MPLILEKEQVQAVYAEAKSRQWVLPAFNSENLTTSEAILSAASGYGKEVGIEDLPIIIGITNNYLPRPQSVFYTHTRNWQIGLKLFLGELKILIANESPYSNLKVMIHLDHIQWDIDENLFGWGMDQFSSIMYDASTLPLDQNIKKTAEFRDKYGEEILIEGACDEIGKSTKNNMTSVEDAEKFQRETGVDIIVANLGTEHRASGSDIRYDGNLARKISHKTGPCLCLHGTSSVSTENLSRLFDDGINRVNIWTTLERDSSSNLFEKMLENAAKIIGPTRAHALHSDGLLGAGTDLISHPSIDYFTTTFRQNEVYNHMQSNILHYLRIFYPV